MRGYKALVQISAVFAIAVCACSPAEKHSDCWRGLDGQYGCGEVDRTTTLQFQGRQLSISYHCMNAFHFEGEPQDEFCFPEFGASSNDFDDDTAPRFHCYGSEDPEGGEREYSCEPYWLLQPDARRKKGAGWFLWLSLQAEGLERDQLLVVANQFRDKGIAETENMIKRDMDRSATPEPTSDPQTANKEVLNMVNSWEKQQEQRKRRTPAEIEAEVAEEVKAWKERP